MSATVSSGQILNKIVFALACFALASVSLASNVRNYRATRLADGDPGHLRQAITLTPGNAAFHHRLGQDLFFTQHDAVGAIEHYRRAAELNPQAAANWLELALAHQALGQTSQQRHALQRALAADPRNPNVAWEAAQQYLAAEQSEIALRQMRVVIEHDAVKAPAAMDLAWRTSHDAGVMLRDAIPSTANGRLAFLSYMVEREEPAGAALAWAELIKLNQKFSPGPALPYVEFLLTSKHADPSGALAVWRVLQGLDSNFPALVEPSTIVNGGFEQTIVNSGLDWRWAPVAGVSAAIDVNDGHTGSKSLAIVFDGTPTADAGVFQYLALQPSARYEFSAYVRNAFISGPGGLRFAISDVRSRKPYYISGLLPETDSWQLVRGTFQTPKTVGTAMLAIVHTPAGQPFRGSFWIDDLELIGK